MEDMCTCEHPRLLHESDGDCRGRSVHSFHQQCECRSFVLVEAKTDVGFGWNPCATDAARWPGRAVAE